MGTSSADSIELREMAEDTAFLAPDEATLHASDSREAASKLADNLEILRAEHVVSNQENSEQAVPLSASRSRHLHIPEDAFNQPAPITNEPPKQQPPPTFLNRAWVQVKKFPRFIRYFVYMAPVGALLTIPIFLGVFAFAESRAPVGGAGGVKLKWFGIWLETVWLSLWVSRILCAILPPLFSFAAGAAGSSNSKKWKDIGSRLELHTALFIWMLAVLCSFLPIVNSNRDPGGKWEDGDPPFIQWIDVMNKVIIAIFILAILNFVEKILIQWIASSFHMRTYAYRIETSKREIQYLIQLFEHSRNAKGGDLPWDPQQPGSSGTRTPMKAFQENAKQVWGKVGNAANRMAGDFTGRKILKDNHPQKVVVELLRTTATSHSLARMIYRSLVKPDRQTIVQEDMSPAFSGSEEAEACFGVFDKDLNGDISMEELETACNEIHLERKAIAASLKDLDSVIQKLDKVFLFIILVVATLVFVSIISGSAAAALTSAGTTVLGLAWMLQATAQEFLQSIIFVFVKHPFDVGDRVTVYGNTGSMMRGDDYYVQEISLLYTEFKKMEGHVVQAPNSLLNNLFILNHRRSNSLADPVQLKMKFGTPNATIEELKARMLDFVMEQKRDFAPRIITEVVSIDEVYSITVNFVFFHKSSFQNELLRLQRHNKLAVELMHQMEELGIEGPRKQQPGGAKDYPFFWADVQHLGSPDKHSPYPHVPPPSPDVRRRRAESRAAAALDAGPDFQDVYDSRRPDAVTRLQSIRGQPGSESRQALQVERTDSRDSGIQRRRGILHRRRSIQSSSKDIV